MEKDDLAGRITEMRKALGLSQAQLGARMVPKKGQSFIGNIESRARRGTASVVEIAHALGVSAYWLKTGKGEKFVGRSLTAEEERILQALPLLDPVLKKVVMDYADAALKGAAEKVKVA